MAGSREGHVYKFLDRTKVKPVLLGEDPLDQNGASLAPSSADRSTVSSTHNDEVSVEG